MSSLSDFSDRVAASRAEMLAAYRRQRPAESEAQPVVTEPTAEIPPPTTAESYIPPEEPPFGDLRELLSVPPLTEFDSTGFLQIHAAAAHNAIPIAHALIVVTRTVNGEEELVAFGETDTSGNTAVWSLPAPEPLQFDQPDTLAEPALYTVRTIADGYTVVRNLSVPLYGGITAVQDVNMIPLPEAVSASEISFTAGGPADLR